MTKGYGKIYSKPSSGKTSFSPQNALKRLAAGLRPDPLGELKRSPRPLAAVSKAMEWICPSGSLAAIRDALQQGDYKIVQNRHRERLHFHLKMH